MANLTYGDQEGDRDEVVIENKEGDKIEEKTAACIVMRNVGVVVTVVFHDETT